MYNEEETIGSVVIRALRHVDEVICIDDGSSDASARIAEACGATVIRHRVNRGYGGALKTLFLHASEVDADALVLLDSDGQHETNDIPAMLEPILSGEADFTIGSRFVEGGGGTDMPAYRRLGIKVITAASNLSSDLGIKDTQSGFRAFSRTALQRLRFDSEGMELSLEMLEDAHEKQLRVLKYPPSSHDVPRAPAPGLRVHRDDLGPPLALTKETAVGSRHSWIWPACSRCRHGYANCTGLHPPNRQHHRFGHFRRLDRTLGPRLDGDGLGAPKCPTLLAIVAGSRIRT